MSPIHSAADISQEAAVQSSNQLFFFCETRAVFHGLLSHFCRKQQSPNLSPCAYLFYSFVFHGCHWVYHHSCPCLFLNTYLQPGIYFFPLISDQFLLSLPWLPAKKRGPSLACECCLILLYHLTSEQISGKTQVLMTWFSALGKLPSCSLPVSSFVEWAQLYLPKIREVLREFSNG